jgi:hypothetical protein
MKFKSVAIDFLVLGVGIVGLSACDSTSNSLPTQSLSPAFVNAMQSSSGCLDVGKALASASSLSARSVLTNADVVGDDDAPVSDAFVHSVIHGADPQSLLQKNAVEQHNCDSLSVNLDGSEMRFKIVSASASQIVTQRVMDSGTNERQGYMQMTFALTGDEELSITEDTLFSASHECSKADKNDEESHEVALDFVVDWSNPLPPEPTIAGNLRDFQERSNAYEHPSSPGYNQSRETDYCNRVRK